ncbi:hypothetical protein, conserved [Eimeria maxima]|uniref:Vesicle transport v-SNARE N-terminal domain-containing protein n=1 Tax=Eimeria maxima TaxID=5804 RepID=U6MCV7_EIMMA|nr:hypothetical protein, conserved [Eimeria maxima]CDJ61866.1 hypothetical protein, conserved [Eimeria maxima]
MLNEYVAEFHSLRAELENMLDSAASRGDLFVATDSKLREMKDCLGAFEMELSSMPPAQRSSHLNQLQTFRDEFSRLQRRCLFATNRGHEASASAELKRGTQALERLNSANIQLGNARKLAEETEEVGANILCNLYMQRESIQRANLHAEQTNSSLRESSSLISKMGKWWSGLIG